MVFHRRILGLEEYLASLQERGWLGNKCIIEFSIPYTAISTKIVESRLQTYATRPKGKVGRRSTGLLCALNTNEIHAK